MSIYQSLKKQSLMAVLPRFLTALFCAVILLGICLPCLIKLAGSPQTLGSGVSSGDYVSFDMSQAVVGFATISSGDKLLSTYYILDLGDGCFASLKAAEKYSSVLAPALAQSESYYHIGSINELQPMGEMRGTAAGMIENERSLLENGLSSAGLEGEITPVCITAGRIGYLSGAALAWLTGLGLAFLIWAAAELALVLSGYYQKPAKAAAEALCTPEDAQRDFDSAAVFDLVRVGEKLLWFQHGAKSGCAPVADILWGFDRLDSRMLGKRRYSLELYLKSGECLDIRTRTGEERKAIAEAVALRGYPFIYGYSQERAGMFARDRDAFLRMAKAERLTSD